MIRPPLLLLFATSLLCGSATGLLRGEEPFAAPGKVTNAALVYWQAFGEALALVAPPPDISRAAIRALAAGQIAAWARAVKMAAGR